MRIKNSKSEKLIFGPAVAVDVLIFDVNNGKLNALLIRISKGPYKNKWALPGGLVRTDETLDEAAKRVLWEKAGIRGIYLEQLYSFGEVKRDVRGRIISVSYFALVDSAKFHPRTTEYYSDIRWKEAKKLPPMAFDHGKIIAFGIERLRNKIEYTNIAYALLPKEFTLTEMQKIYEIILGKKLDKRNFRKKLKMLNILEPEKKMRHGLKSRPAELYRFRKRSLVFTK
ncbi:MAG: hypothetical protein A3J63_01950 [Candidatus Moranbacteria bacterium RIFCSPHIGHO2_02_FULL_40_12b]|nr:MAG: hypothetical protein A3J63_01950 [Candidatus Moranbacteria bacterium RIFCSPHIGHO2_02_FULL_40_12b]